MGAYFRKRLASSSVRRSFDRFRASLSASVGLAALAAIMLANPAPAAAGIMPSHPMTESQESSRSAHQRDAAAVKIRMGGGGVRVIRDYIQVRPDPKQGPLKLSYDSTPIDAGAY